MRRTPVFLGVSVMFWLAAVPQPATAGGLHREVTPESCPDHISVTVHRLNDGRIRVGLVLEPDGDFSPDYVYVAIGDDEKPAFTAQVALSHDPDAEKWKAVAWADDQMYQEGRFRVLYRDPDPDTATDISAWTIRFADFPPNP